MDSNVVGEELGEAMQGLDEEACVLFYEDHWCQTVLHHHQFIRVLLLDLHELMSSILNNKQWNQICVVFYFKNKQLTINILSEMVTCRKLRRRSLKIFTLCYTF